MNESEKRKSTPLYTGLLAYFPRALREVVKPSLAGNEKYLAGQPLHFDEKKSPDHLDACLRHLTDHAQGIVFDDDGTRHLAKVAWRALAQLELDLRKDGKI